MALIDTTYFNTDMAIALPEMSSKITAYINKYEPEILEKILGYDLKKAFTDALAGTPDQKWEDLRDGIEYQYDGIYYNWPGFINSEKISLIANYVFYKFTCSGFYSITSSGIWLNNSENSKHMDLRNYQVSIYNDMVDMIAKLNHFILVKNEEDDTTYPNYYPETINKINIFNI